ncbi:MAG TPA: regulatory protein GemA [Tahibacter sp.]|uniref:regulatory protein GemA n=1 Tax=Tahibacter sp. TaxID=2056211 RepID=UPI002CEB7F03|nr:regulatory protein GemA [Tahibacter sp.]HSX60231.1 regulatory protein GemA [Tahibacter sp.]
MKPRRTRATGKDPRKTDLARIHMLSAQLKLDDDTYRMLLERVTGSRSSKDLDETQRRDVLRELSRLAGDGDRGAAQTALPDAPKRVRAELRAMIGKVSALLTERKLGWSYAHGLAQRMFQTQRIEWLRADQLHKVVAALSYDHARRAARNTEAK